MTQFLATLLVSLLGPVAPAPAALAPPASGTAQLAPASSRASSAPPASGLPAGEVIHYGWRLEGFLGGLASIFLPGSGVGTLSTRPVERGEIETILHITSPGDGREYWTYGSRLAADGSPLRSWSAYTFRGESKRKESKVQERGVQDIASAIYHLRRSPPAVAQRLIVWSDGKLYPVLVSPRGLEEVRLSTGRVRARHFSFVGVQEPGARLWKGRLELWLADDPAATPVVIVVERSLARVRLTRQ